MLPRVLGPSEAAGVTADLPGIPAGLPVGAGAGDNAGAALGLGAHAGDVVVSIGTSGTVFAVTDSPPADESGAVAGFADASGAFLPLVATLNAARILDATAALLGVDHDELGRLALAAEPGAGGLVLQPYFEGERTPNLPDATATLFGMTLATTTREGLARAAIEGMLCGLADGLDAVRGAGVEARRILLIGGAAQNPAVASIAAQVFDVPVRGPGARGVRRPRRRCAGGMGARGHPARLAGGHRRRARGRHAPRHPGGVRGTSRLTRKPRVGPPGVPAEG